MLANPARVPSNIYFAMTATYVLKHSTHCSIVFIFGLRFLPPIVVWFLFSICIFCRLFVRLALGNCSIARLNLHIVSLLFFQQASRR